MKKDLKDLFKNNNDISEAQNFNSIKITLASPEKIKSWTYGEIKNPKQLTIEPSDLKRMDFSVLEFLDQLKTMSVFVENTKE